MKRRRFYRYVLGLTILLTVVLSDINTIYAADAEVVFGSEEYENEDGESFPVGLYIKSSDGYLGKYHIEVEYDSRRLKYDSGADKVSDGRLIFEGEGDSVREIKYWLTFDVLSGGEAYIKVVSAEVEMLDSESEGKFEIVTMAEAPIRIAGEDTALIEEQEELAQKERAEQEQKRKEEEEKKRQEEEQKQKEEEEQKKQQEEEQQRKKEEQELLEQQQIEEQNKQKKQLLFLAIIIFADIFVLALAIVFIRSYRRERKREQERAKIRAQKRAEEKKRQLVARMGKDQVQLIDIERIDEYLEKLKMENEIKQTCGSKPVIRVKDVTMEFKIATSNVSGLKEYVIQKIKHRISYRRLLALDHVSFNVYKGEVVGIIGTNGSGKSTLLRIVSGALIPTSGKVLVDRRKVQLLTLGTGFDMELTARENVYLNGSIIGYTKEFLDKHYDEIVEFAELQGFMEEKVKNFSSGMVSRLGFSIATAGAAAEILILDEVLSVGDEFFRKKSLARIKEMIHGGSTVLMVSHGMSTILENCTRVVWIEKGVLRMVGEPKVVCEAYRLQNNKRD